MPFHATGCVSRLMNFTFYAKILNERDRSLNVDTKTFIRRIVYATFSTTYENANVMKAAKQLPAETTTFSKQYPGQVLRLITTAFSWY